MFKREPIIQSLLDMDFYKFTMGQFAFKRYPNVPVKYKFKNRTSGVALTKFIKENELREELDHISTLRFNNSEIHYLRGTNEYGERMFSESYLEFLAKLELPPYKLSFIGDEIELEFEGPWSTTIYWETLALSVINELYTRTIMEGKSIFEQEKIHAKGVLNLAKKIKRLRSHPGIIFTDFGTRRRFSREWQDYIVKTMSNELKSQFRGTSNVFLAMKYGLLPMGTSAHEMYMVMAGIMKDDDFTIRNSHNRVLKEWWEDYKWGLSIALTDTYGSDFFFWDMHYEQAEKWKGLRQDSGDPIEFGEKAISFYQKLKIDPCKKIIIFSDGLDVDTMIKIEKHFRGRIMVSFGWGTNLTNDLGIGPLSIVIKVAEANGSGVVKLSDNLAKAMGKPEDIERFKKIFVYNNMMSRDCIY